MKETSSWTCGTYCLLSLGVLAVLVGAATIIFAFRLPEIHVGEGIWNGIPEVLAGIVAILCVFRFQKMAALITCTVAALVALALHIAAVVVCKQQLRRLLAEKTKSERCNRAFRSLPEPCRILERDIKSYKIVVLLTGLLICFAVLQCITAGYLLVQKRKSNITNTVLDHSQSQLKGTTSSSTPSTNVAFKL